MNNREIKILFLKKSVLILSIIEIKAPIAQLDRVVVFGTKGSRFESW